MNNEDKMSDESLEIFTSHPEEIDPDENIIATYYVEGHGISLKKASVKIAAEESIGTWTEISTATEFAIKKLAAKAYEFRTEQDNTGTVKIAYPLILFDYDTGGIPNILSIVAGNLFGSKSLENVRLLDLDFPKDVVSSFKGPKYGIDGVRSLIGTQSDKRPHLGTIIKPKVGLNPKETARVAYEAAVGGVDFIKDDETLTNQLFCPLTDRISAVMESLDKAESETGRKILYAPDITAETYKIPELADSALSHGAPFLMLDLVPCGYSAIRLLSEDPSIKVPIHVHRAGHAAFTRNPKHGISLRVLAKLTRLSGGDQLHTGTAAGKMSGEVKEIISINEFLKSPQYHLRSTMPVASGGIHPGIVEENIKILGRDLVIQAGGGIHGHPKGTMVGARAMRLAINAAIEGVSLKEAALKSEELGEAIKHWGKIFT